MTKQEAIKIFEEKKVRMVWDTDKEEWYFSIVDVIAVLTDSPNPRNYWKVLKHRLIKEGNELVTNCNQLKNLPSFKSPAEPAETRRETGSYVSVSCHFFRLLYKFLIFVLPINTIQLCQHLI